MTLDQGPTKNPSQHSPEGRIEGQAPGQTAGEGTLSHNFYNNDANKPLVLAMNETGAQAPAPITGEYLNVPQLHPDVATPATLGLEGQAQPAAGNDTPMLNPQVQQDVQNAGSMVFTNPADNQSSPPDYRLTVGNDGSLQLEKVGNSQPQPGQPLNVEIDPNNKALQDAIQKDPTNTSLQEAIKSADRNLKDYIREMMTRWQETHPGQPHPNWWDDILSKQPDVPQQQAPVQTQQAPQNWQPRSAEPGEAAPSHNTGGGFSPGGGFAGHGGFDQGGHFRGTGSDNEGRVWTGGENQKGAPVGPGETAKAADIYQYLRQHGMSDNAASGILGNIQTESSFKTNAFNKGEGAIGICQWEGPRRTALENFARGEGKPVTDLHVQLDFMMKEIHDRGLTDKLNNAGSPAQAAAIFDAKFEVSAGTSRGQRMANAEHWSNTVAKTDKTPMS